MSSGRTRLVTYSAPVNIAVIKYWGKRDVELILPLNDSISGTLDTSDMCATTTVLASPQFSSHRLWLNKSEQPINQRVQACIDEVKNRATLQQSVPEQQLDYHIHICSENNFPTAAGLASSAAGYACLVAALSKLYHLKGDLTGIARLGSGSACRSLYGGFVQWHSGTLPDGSDSIATQIVPAQHWPQMRVLILVVSDDRKKISSTNGMQISVRTSELLKYRVSECVPKRTASIKKAILERDFETFAEITMKDSNQFHAVASDTYPPCVYTNDVSHAIIRMVHSYNEACGSNKIAYTFDAGPNACLYMLEDQIPFAYSLVKETFPSDLDKDVEYVKGNVMVEAPLPEFVRSGMVFEKHKKNLIKYLIHTSIGDGPYEVIDVNGHLMDEAGLPKFL
ncbi:mevalonate diphosphate decarboxylase [Arctopsyche grandis]|uniref:mevalonate diphosphate decarboxylase n=1 Tax=Arctopsyche grandis TaxID=121162 RepID=UPI00406D9A68